MGSILVPALSILIFVKTPCVTPDPVVPLYVDDFMVSPTINVPVVSDFSDPEWAQATGEVCDLVQVPAYLCRQTSILRAAAETGVAKQSHRVNPVDGTYNGRQVKEPNNE